MATAYVEGSEIPYSTLAQYVPKHYLKILLNPGLLDFAILSSCILVQSDISGNRRMLVFVISRWKLN